MLEHTIYHSIIFRHMLHNEGITIVQEFHILLVSPSRNSASAIDRCPIYQPLFGTAFGWIGHQSSHQEDGVHKIARRAVSSAACQRPVGAKFGIGKCTLWDKNLVHMLAKFGENPMYRFWEMDKNKSGIDHVDWRHDMHDTPLILNLRIPYPVLICQMHMQRPHFEQTF